MSARRCAASKRLAEPDLAGGRIHSARGCGRNRVPGSVEHASGRKAEQKCGTVQAGPGGPWDSWIWSERAAPLAFGRVSARRRCGVKRQRSQTFGAGSFAAPAASFFPGDGERNQRIAGDAADGLRLRFAPPRSIGTAFPGPHYGGRVPVRFYNGSGARSLSDGQRFLPAHWGLVFPKLRTVRFPFCAWLCRGTRPVRVSPQGRPLRPPGAPGANSGGVSRDSPT